MKSAAMTKPECDPGTANGMMHATERLLAAGRRLLAAGRWLLPSAALPPQAAASGHTSVSHQKQQLPVTQAFPATGWRGNLTSECEE
eukprot:365557-Chlamydomonas_euryale.AAC.3